MHSKAKPVTEVVTSEVTIIVADTCAWTDVIGRQILERGLTGVTFAFEEAAIEQHLR